ncbi:MAG: dnaA [Bacillales bacterium]|nr:dnaA [Bacillales bacterium]
MENLSSLWQKTLEDIKKNLAKSSFDTWFKDLSPLKLEKNEFSIQATSDFVKNRIQTNYLDTIQQALLNITGETYKVIITSGETLIHTSVPINKFIDQSNFELAEFEFASLLDKYTFDKFVVGSGNKFAHAASLAVAEDPGNAYNPLFIYGGSGLGKTHLLQAIGHSVRDRNSVSKIVYVSSEKFMNEFIQSIRESKSEEFRQKYRKVDLLLIDDIQFLAGRSGTQEEFFHTFNTLFEAGKQIVITSDRPPNEIQTLENRLRTRFSWGLITDISEPDLETRIAILQRKIKSEGLDIGDDVLLYIANSIETNIRELEGALTRVLAYSSLMNEEISENLAIEALKNIIPTSNSNKTVSILDIQKLVANHYHIRLEDFKSKTRTKTIAFPRQIAMYLTRNLTSLSLPQIGEEFGGRDHTTVMHACEKIKELQKEDKIFYQQMETFKKSLKF